MEKIHFKDYPDTTTPTDADNLNLLQDNIEDNLNLLQDNIENAINRTVLYNNATGTLGNVPLSEENSNFKYLLVTSYLSSTGTMQTDIIHCSTQGETNYIHLGGNVSRMGTNEMVLFAKNYNLSGTELSVNQYAPFVKVVYNINSGLSSSTTDELYITKVEGIN